MVFKTISPGCGVRASLMLFCGIITKQREWLDFFMSPGAVFTNIPILVLTLVVYHFKHMPDFISITVSTILALKASCGINILSNY